MTDGLIRYDKKKQNTDHDLHYERIATWLHFIILRFITVTITGASHISGPDHWTCSFSCRCHSNKKINKCWTGAGCQGPQCWTVGLVLFTFIQIDWLRTLNLPLVWMWKWDGGSFMIYKLYSHLLPDNIEDQAPGPPHIRKGLTGNRQTVKEMFPVLYKVF